MKFTAFSFLSFFPSYFKYDPQLAVWIIPRSLLEMQIRLHSHCFLKWPLSTSCLLEAIMPGCPSTHCLASVAFLNHGGRIHEPFALVSSMPLKWVLHGRHCQIQLLDWDGSCPPWIIGAAAFLFSCFVGTDNSLGSLFTGWKSSCVGSCIEGTLPLFQWRAGGLPLTNLFNKYSLSWSTDLSYSVKFPSAPFFSKPYILGFSASF